MLPICIGYYRSCSSSKKQKIVNIKTHIIQPCNTLSFRDYTSLRKKYTGGFKGCQTGGTLPEMHSTWLHRSSAAPLLHPGPGHQDCVREAWEMQKQQGQRRWGKTKAGSCLLQHRLTAGQFFLSISLASENRAHQSGGGF